MTATAELRHTVSIYFQSFLLLLFCAIISVNASEDASGKGGIYVRTDPVRAEVYIDGVLAGISPCAVAEIPAGRVIVSARRGGFYDSEQVVEIKGGEIKNAHLQLNPREGAGHILALVEPAGARVELDSDFRGVTPLRIENLEAGVYRLRITHPGYDSLAQDISVEPDRHHVVRGTMHALEDTGDAYRAAEPWPGTDRSELGRETDNGNTADIFRPVRNLLNRREYGAAAEKLKSLLSEHPSSDRDAFSEEDLRFISSAEEIVREGMKALGGRIGEENYPLPIKSGISITGKLVDVQSDHIIMEVRGSARTVDSRDIHIDRIIRLAASAFPPHRPENRIRLAYLYAMEREFNRAAAEIERAQSAAHDVTLISNILRREQRFADREAAEAEERQAAQREESRRKAAESVEEAPADGKVLLLDLYHGSNLPSRIESEVARSGYRLRNIYSPVSENHLQDCDVFILNTGLYSATKPGESQLKALINHIRSGGGLLIFGAPVTDQKEEGNYILEPLLAQFNLEIKDDELITSRMAPFSHRSDIIQGQRRGTHVITAGISGYVPFPADTAMLVANRPILSSSEHVMARREGITGVPLLTAGLAGEGRVAVFAGMPAIDDSRAGANAVEIVMNAIRWASIK